MKVIFVLLPLIAVANAAAIADPPNKGAMDLLSLLGNIANSETLQHVFKVVQLLQQLHQSGQEIQGIIPQVEQLLGSASQEVKDYVNSVATSFGLKPVFPNTREVRRACTQHQEVLQGLGLVGVYRPQCEADGTYSAMQCHGSTGYCWCVTEGGDKLIEARPPGTLRSCNCIRQQHKVTSSGLMGAFLPKCEANGQYSAVQCHASTGYCWCSDSEGNKLTEPAFTSGNLLTC